MFGETLRRFALTSHLSVYGVLLSFATAAAFEHPGLQQLFSLPVLLALLFGTRAIARWEGRHAR